MPEPHDSSVYPDDIDLGRYLAVIFRRRRLVVVAALVGILTTAILTYTAPRMYESEAVLQLPTVRRESPMMQPSEDSEAAFATPAAAIQVLSTLAFLEQAAEVAAIDESAQVLRRVVKLEPIRDTRMVRVRVRYRNPEQARALAQAISDRFLVVAGRHVTERRQIVARRLSDVDRQIAQVDRLLSLSQSALSRLLATRGERADGFATSFALNAASVSQEVRQSLIETQTKLRIDLLELMPPTVIAAPTLPGAPVASRPLQNVALGVLLGLAVGSVLALSLEALHVPGGSPIPVAAPRLGTPTPHSQQTQAGK